MAPWLLHCVCPVLPWGSVSCVVRVAVPFVWAQGFSSEVWDGASDMSTRKKQVY